ncbi:glycoside hydrolase [Chytriomyces sp. MP71]|nr:glycoside hydrolase [Chytriomyces sp. MP71]
MLPAFDTITGLPVNDFRISDGFKKVNDDKGVGLAEIGTFQLEFQYLSDVTGNPIYAEKALRVYEQLAKVKVPIPGLYPEKIHADNLTILGKVKISLGGMSDSYYEYLLKMWLATGHEKFYKLYETAANDLTHTAQSFAKYMVKYSNDGFLYIPTGFVTRDDPALEPQIQFEDIFNHLACFAGGMFSTGAVAARTLHHPRSEWAHLYEIGQNLTEYCWQMYNRTNSGIGPEVVFGATLTSSDGRYQLRPETIESLFYMWRYTHAGVYRERAWTIAQAIDRYCRVPGGYHSLANVESPRQGGLNRQESFFLAETLKYLYLIFADDDTIALEKYVFNTEAHVLSVRGHGRRKQASDFVPLPYR